MLAYSFQEKKPNLLAVTYLEAIFQASSTKFCLFKFEEKKSSLLYLTKKKCLNHKNNNNKKNLCNYKSYTQISNYRTLTLQVQTYISYTLNSTVACQVSCQLVEKKNKIERERDPPHIAAKIGQVMRFLPWDAGR